MKISSPLDGNWHNVEGTTAAAIANELNLPSKTGWGFKVNGEVRKSLGTVHDDDVVEMIEYVDTETVQSNTVSEPSGDNKH